VLGPPNEAHMSTAPVPRTPEMLVGVGARILPSALSPSNDTSHTGELVCSWTFPLVTSPCLAMRCAHSVEQKKNPPSRRKPTPKGKEHTYTRRCELFESTWCLISVEKSRTMRDALCRCTALFVDKQHACMLSMQTSNTSATINMLAHRWQLHPPPKQGTARAEAVAALAAWPQRLEHSSRKLFRNRADVVAAHETAPRWHLRGDFRSAADCAAVVNTDAVGEEHLRNIAQMQLQLVRACCSIVGS
jgi:hypothetical protein